MIADEVQSGMGRCGTPFAVGRAGVEPDILTAAKSLGGGFPVGAVLTRAEWAERVSVGDLGTTFGGGPLAAAMVETVIDEIERGALIERVARLSALIRERCTVGPVTSSQGAGLLLGLRTTRPAKEVARELLDRDIMVGGAADPHVIRLLPPYVLDETHVDTLAAALKEIAA
jgi:acetylornithine/succinyldiaminopimelate/putrescine aminotransferase